MQSLPCYVLVLALLLPAFPVLATTIGPISDLFVSNAVISPDGFNRSAVLAEGTFPGPLIAAQKGDDFFIDVFNLLSDTTMATDTSVHWHGIFQINSSWADGPVGVAQCPIKPNNDLFVNFIPFNQTGTFWYHSHLSTQYCDGLRGPLVIYDPDDPHKDMYDVDDSSTVITLADWYHVPASGPTRIPLGPSSTIINGLGRYNGGPMSPLSVISVEYGKRYRFRLVGASCAASFNFSIDGHKMTVIETDGIETKPLVVDSLRVFPAQRYSVVVTAKRHVGNYWIRALSSQPGQSFDGGQNSAILRYVGAPNDDPKTEHGPYRHTYDDGHIHPLVSPGAPGIPEPGKADVNLNLVPGVSDGQFTINGVPYISPPVPVLLQILNGARHPSQLLPKGSVYELPYGKVIEISMPAGAPGGPHPVHLHGHTFDVIRTPGSTTYNFKNPIRRDTISLGHEETGDNVTFRFRTDNPGPWLLHCHINPHLNNGFAVVLAEATNETAAQESQVIPDDWKSECGV